MRRAERRSNATLDLSPTPDIATIEAAAESLMRLGDVRNAIALWAYRPAPERRG